MVEPARRPELTRRRARCLGSGLFLWVRERPGVAFRSAPDGAGRIWGCDRKAATEEYGASRPDGHRHGGVDRLGLPGVAHPRRAGRRSSRSAGRLHRDPDGARRRPPCRPADDTGTARRTVPPRSECPSRRALPPAGGSPRADERDAARRHARGIARPRRIRPPAHLRSERSRPANGVESGEIIGPKTVFGPMLSFVASASASRKPQSPFSGRCLIRPGPGASAAQRRRSPRRRRSAAGRPRPRAR